MKWDLFVEGEYDKQFVQSLLESLNANNIQVRILGGGVQRLRSVANQIQRSSDAGRHVALLLDADSDINSRRIEMDQEITRLSLPIESTFLLPDDERDGNLETLLEGISPADHRAVYECLDKYEACLRSLDSGYRTPGQKARIYAYCEAIGAVTGPEKEYECSTHWDLEAPALERLLQFLRGLAGSDMP